MAKFLGSTGLGILWGKIKDWVRAYAYISTNNNVSTIHIGGNEVTPITDVDGKADKATNLTGATKTKITYNSQGIVTGGADLAAGDIPTIPLSKINDVTATAAELNILDGVTASTAELNYVDGVTSNIQTQLDGISDRIDDIITAGGEPNQNAFSNITIGNTTIEADTKTDTLTLAAGGAVTLTPNATSDTVTIGVDISGKADKVTNPTAGNVVTLDANGNLVDSGKSADSIGTDTKNTTGSTNDTAKLYIVGAKEQSTNPQTYSQANAYVTAGKVYSNAKETVNLSDTQALSNKTYNGYTLAAACAKGVDTSITAGSTSANVPTTAAVESRITSAIQSAQVGAANFQGTVTAQGGFSPTNYKKGYYWVVGEAGTYAGQVCEVGDMIFCVSDYSSSYKASDFNVIQTNLDIQEMEEGDMNSATNNWA